MKIGIIGGSGFIGSHLVDRLLGIGYDVVVLDIARPHREDVPYLPVDVASFSQTAAALDSSYDAVYMLAAMVDVSDVYRNPVGCGEVNIMGTANVLEVARRNNIGRVILASSVWVYNLVCENEVNESTALLIAGIDRVYTASKMASELYCHCYRKIYGQKFTVLRYGITYGPRTRDGNVVATFIRRALRGEPLIIYGDGSRYRNLIYVGDLVEGNVAALKDVAENNTYTLNGIRPVSVREVAETIERLLGNVEIRYEQAKPGDYTPKATSLEKTKKELGWEPKISLEEGLRQSIEWYRRSMKSSEL